MGLFFCTLLCFFGLFCIGLFCMGLFCTDTVFSFESFIWPTWIGLMFYWLNLFDELIFVGGQK